MTPTIILVGADKGGVGKTLVSRVLLDYLKEKNVRPTVYDTEGALHRFYSYAKVIDITKSSGQAEVFDGVEKAGTTVVDMKAGLLSSTLRAMRSAGKLDKADRGEDRQIIFHILGSNTQSMDEIIDTHALLGEAAEHIFVENHQGTDGTFFKWDTEKRKKFFESVKPTAEIVIPHLDTLAGEDVDLKGSPFAAYIANVDNKNKDWWARIVRHWRGQVFKTFDTLNLVAKD